MFCAFVIADRASVARAWSERSVVKREAHPSADKHPEPRAYVFGAVKGIDLLFFDLYAGG